MNLFGKLLAPWTRKGVSYAEMIGGQPLKISDTAVAGRNAYAKNGFLSTCIDAVAKAVASVPLRVYKEIEVDGKPQREEVIDSPLVEFLARPSRLMTGDMFWLSHMTEFALMGNAPWIKIRNGSNMIEASLLRADEFRVIPTSDELGIARYERLVNGAWLPVEVEDILHFRGANPLDTKQAKWLGMSITEKLVNPILTTYYVQEWNRLFFKQGAIPPAILTAEGIVDEETARMYQERWNKGGEGLNKWHKIRVIGSGLKLQKVGSDHKEMGFEQLFRFDREEIMAVCGTPPAVAGVMEYANYANADAQFRLFYELTILPYLHYNESVINEMLIPAEFPDEGIYVEYDTSGVRYLQEDALQRAQRDQIYINTGIKTVNEIRAEINLEPVEWGDEPPSSPPALGGSLALSSPMFPSLRKDGPTAERLAELEIWHKFNEKLTLRESIFQKLAREFFLKQGEGIRRFIEEEYGKSLKQLPTPVDIEKVLEVLLTLMQQLKLRELTEATIEKILAQAGGEALKQVGIIDMSFSVSSELVQKWIEQNALDLVTTVHQTSKGKLRQMFIDTHESGATIQEISKQIDKLFGDKGGFADYRAKRIARTETIKAHNKGAVEGYRQSDVVEGKRWLTAPGAENPRHELLVVDPVALDAPFNIEGYLMDFPGDPNGPAEHVINCRCTVVPILKEG